MRLSASVSESMLGFFFNVTMYDLKFKISMDSNSWPILQQNETAGESFKEEKIESLRNQFLNLNP